ncbi:hypothetical protein QBZ16_003137 [Prototheca wickerhamii]|uniref:RNase H type-1 domain-containing protein n=1 Tax=Prototheca wickerhamii TaxID=3111 RepID=A0AAD9IML8_PROWI|nr:hypothetical protein QBZ16_003137 [Prototheca wickerhamii]
MSARKARFLDDKERDVLGRAVDDWNQACLGSGLSGGLALAVATCRLEHQVARALDGGQGRVPTLEAVLQLAARVKPLAVALPPSCVAWLRVQAWSLARSAPALGSQELIPVLARVPDVCDDWAAELLGPEHGASGQALTDFLGALESLPLGFALPTSLWRRSLPQLRWRRMPPPLSRRWVAALCLRAPTVLESPGGVGDVLAALCEAAADSSDAATRMGAWDGLTMVLLAWARGVTVGELQTRVLEDGPSPGPAPAPVPDLIALEEAVEECDEKPDTDAGLANDDAAPVRLQTELVALAAEAFGGQAQQRPGRAWQAALTRIDPSQLSRAAKRVPGDALLRALLVVAAALPAAGAAGTRALNSALSALCWVWIARAVDEGAEADQRKGELSEAVLEEAQLLRGLEALSSWEFLCLALAVGGAPEPDTTAELARLTERVAGPEALAMLSFYVARAPEAARGPLRPALLAALGRPEAALSLLRAPSVRLVATVAAALPWDEAPTSPECASNLAALVQAMFYRGLDGVVRPEISGPALGASFPAAGEAEAVSERLLALARRSRADAAGWLALLAGWLRRGGAASAGFLRDLGDIAANGTSQSPASLALWMEVARSLSDSGIHNDSDASAALRTECLRSLAALTHHYHARLPAVGPALAALAAPLQAGERRQPAEAASGADEERASLAARLVEQMAGLDTSWQQRLAVARSETPVQQDESEEDDALRGDGDSGDYSGSLDAPAGFDDMPAPPEQSSSNNPAPLVDAGGSALEHPLPAQWPPSPADAVRLRAYDRALEASLEESATLLEYWSNRRGKQSVPHGAGGAPGRAGDVPAVLSSALGALWEAARRAEEAALSCMAQLRATVASRFVPGKGDVQEDAAYADNFAKARRQAVDVVRRFPEDPELVTSARQLYAAELALLAGARSGGPEEEAHASGAGAQLASELASLVVRLLAEGAVPACAVPWASETLERALHASRGTLFSSLDTRERSSLVATLASRYRRGLALWAAADGGEPVLPILRALLDPGPLLEAGRLEDWETALRATLEASPHDDLLAQFDARRWALLLLGGSDAEAASRQEQPVAARLQRLLVVVILLLDADSAAAQEMACGAIESALSMLPEASFCALLAAALTPASAEARRRALGALGTLPRGVLGAGVLCEALNILAAAAWQGDLPPSALPAALGGLVFGDRGLWRLVLTGHGSIEEDRRAEAFTARIGTVDDDAWRHRTAQNYAAEAEEPSSAGPGPSGRPGGLMLMPIDATDAQSGLAEAREEAIAALRHAAALQADRAPEVDALACLVLPEEHVPGAPPDQAACAAWEALCRHLLPLLPSIGESRDQACFGEEARRRWAALAWEEVAWDADRSSSQSHTAPAASASQYCTLRVLAEALLARAARPLVLESVSRMRWEGTNADACLLALRAATCLDEGDWPIWLVELLIPGGAVTGEGRDPGTLERDPGGRTQLQALLAAADWAALDVRLSATAAVPWLALPAALGAAGRGAAERVVRAAGVLIAAAGEARSLVAARVAARAVAPLTTLSLVSGRPWDSGHVGAAPAAHSVRVMVPDDIPLELLEGTEEGAALARAGAEAQGLETKPAAAENTGPAAPPSADRSAPQSAFEVHATWRLSSEDAVDGILPCLLQLLSAVAGDLAVEEGRMEAPTRLQVLAPTPDAASLVEAAAQASSSSTHLTPSGAIAAAHSSQGSLTRDFLCALLYPFLDPAQAQTARVAGQGDATLGPEAVGVLPWDAASALFVLDRQAQRGERRPESLAALQLAASQRLAAFAASERGEASGAGRALLSFSLLLLDARPESGVPQLWEQLLQTVDERTLPLQKHVLEPLQAASTDRLLALLKAAARASQPLTLTVVLDSLYQGTLALDKWVWQELVSEEWAESLSLRSMALRLSDPLEEHVAKQQAGSEASSSSSVVDQTLKRIRGFQLGRNKSPSKEGSEGPLRDGLRRESPSLLDKFKSALHIDGGEEPGAQTSKGQTRKRFVEGWNKGLSALREKIKKETGVDEASKGAEGQANGGSPTQPWRRPSDDGRLAMRAEESLWIRVGLAAFAVSAYVRSVLAPALASATPRAGLTAGSELSPRSGHVHSKSLSMGSWRFDDAMLREMDTVMEARDELDSLEQLQQSKLLRAHASEFHAFFSLLPELLSSATAVATFQLRLQQLLVPQARILAILRPSGLGAVLYDKSTGAEVSRVCRYVGTKTNNEAEYLGLIAGMQEARRLGCQSIEIRGDSQLVINQIQDNWKVKADSLKPYHQTATDLYQSFPSRTAHHIPSR